MANLRNEDEKFLKQECLENLLNSMRQIRAGLALQQPLCNHISENSFQKNNKIWYVRSETTKQTGQPSYPSTKRDQDLNFRRFGDGGTLRKHERIHTGEKPYLCPVCSKAFNQRVVLREHIRAHHSGTEGRLSESCYECVVCGSIFVSSRDLYSHLVQHSDENTAKHRFPSSRKYSIEK